ncbi:hypothetical protein ABZ413_28330 [Nocardia rhamnosiphila]|uniref:hypothetical protein n=1 Tax=Nocardia rhamnosiphila TaxID=426716 RepID=UPI0033E33B54
MTWEMRIHLQKLLADLPGSTIPNPARAVHGARSGSAVSPQLILPQAPLEQLIRGPLPKAPEPAPIPHDDVLYGISTVGEAGRALDQYVMTALDWLPGTRLEIQPLDDLLLVGMAADGPVHVTADRYFRIPFRQRRRVGLLVGSVSCSLDAAVANNS